MKLASWLLSFSLLATTSTSPASPARGRSEPTPHPLSPEVSAELGFASSVEQGTVVKLETPAIKGQKQSQWCWASSIQNVLASYGVQVKQETVVKATWGRVQNLPVFNPTQAVANLLKANAKVAPEGKVVHPFIVAGAPVPAHLVRELEREKSPVMFFYLHPRGGHVVVCYGIEYMGSPSAPIINKIFVKDPWTGESVTWAGSALASNTSAAIYCRVAPKPKTTWTFNGVSYHLSPTYEVLDPRNIAVARVWFHREDQKWHIWDAAGKDWGAIP